MLAGKRQKLFKFLFAKMTNWKIKESPIYFLFIILYYYSLFIIYLYIHIYICLIHWWSFFICYNFAKSYAILITSNYHLIQDIKKQIKRKFIPVVYEEQNLHQIFLKCHFDITRDMQLAQTEALSRNIYDRKFITRYVVSRRGKIFLARNRNRSKCFWCCDVARAMAVLNSCSSTWGMFDRKKGWPLLPSTAGCQNCCHLLYLRCLTSAGNINF